MRTGFGRAPGAKSATSKKRQRASDAVVDCQEESDGCEISFDDKPKKQNTDSRALDCLDDQNQPPKRRKVTFAGADKENMHPNGKIWLSANDEEKPKTTKKKKKRKTKRQSTLTQLDYVHFLPHNSSFSGSGDDDERTASDARRKRPSRAVSAEKRLRQQTITQIDFSSHLKPHQDEDLDHLGYGIEYIQDDCLPPNEYETEFVDIDETEAHDDTHHERSKKHITNQTELSTTKRIRTQPVPDSEDDEEEEEEMRCSTKRLSSPCSNESVELGISSRSSPLSTCHAISIQGHSKLRAPEIDDLSSLLPVEAITAFRETCSQPLPTTPTRRIANEIPSSQTPQSARLSMGGTPLTGRSLLLVSPCGTPTHSAKSMATAGISRPPRPSPKLWEESIRSNLEQVPEETQTSPTKRRIQAFNARFADLSRFPMTARRNPSAKSVPRFIPSSTKTSGWSEEGVADDVESQFSLGEETQAELRSLNSFESGTAASLRTESTLNRSSTHIDPTNESDSAELLAEDSKAADVEASKTELREPFASQRLQSASAVLEESQTHAPDFDFDDNNGRQASQESASEQLLRETQNFRAHHVEEEINCDLETTTPRPTQPLQPSQVSTVGTSVPNTPRSQTRFAKTSQSALPSLLVPSSPLKPKQILNSSPILMAAEACIPSSPVRPCSSLQSSLVRPGPLPSSLPEYDLVEPSRTARSALAIGDLHEYGNVTATQLLPASLIDDSIPLPPVWEDDDDD